MAHEIESIVDNAVKIAKEKSHEYVMTEHLLLAMLRQGHFRRLVEQFGVEIDMLDQELDSYLNSLMNLVKPGDVQPKKTQSLERVFNRANVQVMFTGRRAMNLLDVYLSIMAETNSHAHYFLLKYGMKKSEFVEFYQKNHTQVDSKMTSNQADEVLAEYCTSLTA